MIYIASQTFGTVCVRETLPPGYQGELDKLVDEGPAWIGPPRFCVPPRGIATADPQVLHETHGYSRRALAKLVAMPLGCYYWDGDDWVLADD